MLYLSQIKDNMPEFPDGWELDTYDNHDRSDKIVYGVCRKGRYHDVTVDIDSAGDININVEYESSGTVIPLVVMKWLIANQAALTG